VRACRGGVRREGWEEVLVRLSLLTSCCLLGQSPCCCRAAVSVVNEGRGGVSVGQTAHGCSDQDDTHEMVAGARLFFWLIRGSLPLFFLLCASSFLPVLLDTFSSDRKHTTLKDAALDPARSYPCRCRCRRLPLSLLPPLWRSPFWGGVWRDEFLHKSLATIVWKKPSTIMEVGRRGACLAVPS
jgi:hypothetical protein